ncbi:MAG: ankyrin repeat domain-containing protein [Bryobacteraceae bacterium]
MRRLQLVCVLMFASRCLGANPEDFFHAIRSDATHALKALATNSAAVNRPDPRGRTPVHYAAVAGSVESVWLLISVGADVNARDQLGVAPLSLAAYSPEKVRLLLAAGARPNDADRTGATALIVAAGGGGAFESVRHLLDAGAEVNHATEDGCTALLAAAGGGTIETVELLLKRGARVDAVDKNGLTPLAASIGANEPERIRLLLASGANVNSAVGPSRAFAHGPIGRSNSTPLILASTFASAKTVLTLVAAGAAVNLSDAVGVTPLMAASTNPDPEVTAALLDAGAGR